MTLRTYAKLLDAREQHEEATVILEQALSGKDMESSGGERTRTETVEEAQKVAFLRDSADAGD